MNLKLTAWLLAMLWLLPQNSHAQSALPHVIVFGLDGLSPDGIRHAKTPNFNRLMKAGAWSLHARGVMPTSSSPNWASMIMGAGPEQHGVTSNDWETNLFTIAPIIVGPGNMFPTIFSLLREQKPNSVNVSFYDWDGFGRLFERRMVNVAENCKGPTNTVLRAIQQLQTQRPNLMFLQLDHVDHAGHTYGHGTPEYYDSVEVADQLLGQLIEALEKGGWWKDTIILITADHGGVKKGHGGATMAEIEIPWIIAGPGIVTGKEITHPVYTYDTAATLARIFEVKTPAAWIGRPVSEALVSEAGK